MKNIEIIVLANAGIAKATGYELSSDEAYQLYQLKKQVEKAVTEIRSAESELVGAAGIENPKVFDARTKELMEKSERTEEEKEELAEHTARLDKLNELRRALYNDETEIKVKPIPFESWFKLQKENAKDNIFNGEVESILEDVFWTAPQDNSK